MVHTWSVEQIAHPGKYCLHGTQLLLADRYPYPGIHSHLFAALNWKFTVESQPEQVEASTQERQPIMMTSQFSYWHVALLYSCPTPPTQSAVVTAYITPTGFPLQVELEFSLRLCPLIVSLSSWPMLGTVYCMEDQSLAPHRHLSFANFW